MNYCLLVLHWLRLLGELGNFDLTDWQTLSVYSHLTVGRGGMVSTWIPTFLKASTPFCSGIFTISSVLLQTVLKPFPVSNRRGNGKLSTFTAGCIINSLYVRFFLLKNLNFSLVAMLPSVVFVPVVGVKCPVLRPELESRNLTRLLDQRKKKHKRESR